MNQLQYVLEKKKYIIIDLRIHYLKEIFISFEMIIQLLSNLFKKKLTNNYFYSILKVIKPKVVLTACDNHRDFFQIAKLLDRDIKFMVIQNANRLDFWKNDYFYKQKITGENYNKEFYIPHYYCFGQNDVDNCKYYNINIKKFYKIGSINTSNFFYYLSKNKIKLIKNKFDICLISEPSLGVNDHYKKNNIEQGYGLLATYTIKFARRFNCNFIFASKRFKYNKLYNRTLYDDEINFYKNYLKKSDFNYLLKKTHQKENFYSSYFSIFESKVAIATQSTLLKDKISVGEKILSCNLTGFELYDFPLKGICAINNCSYKEFEKRLIEVLNISTKKYFKRINKSSEYIMKFTKKFGAIEAVKNDICKILQ
jgi:surface carbohydrate biosynthesis protein